MGRDSSTKCWIICLRRVYELYFNLKSQYIRQSSQNECLVLITWVDMVIGRRKEIQKVAFCALVFLEGERWSFPKVDEIQTSFNYKSLLWIRYYCTYQIVSRLLIETATPPHLSFNRSKIGLDGLGLTDQCSILLFVASNALLKFSNHVTYLVGLK